MQSTFVFSCLMVLAATAASASPIAFADDDAQLVAIIPTIDEVEWLQQQAVDVSRQRRAADNANGVNVNVDHGKQGTNVAVDAQRRLWESRNGRTTVDGQASYSQHFGGPAGRQPAQRGVGVMFRHRF